jgi:hypothetical protein
MERINRIRGSFRNIEILYNFSQPQIRPLPKTLMKAGLLKDGMNFAIIIKVKGGEKR